MKEQKNVILWLNPIDNVVVALRQLTQGEVISMNNRGISAKEDIPKGHKMAIQLIEQGEMLIKYGEKIGEAIKVISEGEHVHTHNVRDITAEVSERERKRLGL